MSKYCISQYHSYHKYSTVVNLVYVWVFTMTVSSSQMNRAFPIIPSDDAQVLKSPHFFWFLVFGFGFFFSCELNWTKRVPWLLMTL